PNESLDWWIVPTGSGASVRTGAFQQFQAQQLSNPAWQYRIVPLEWGDDGSILFAAGTQDASGRGDASSLWQVAMQTGGHITRPAAPVTSGPGLQMQGSRARMQDRRRMAFANLEWQFGVWAADIDGNAGKIRGEMKRITGSDWYAGSPSLSLDG